MLTNPINWINEIVEKHSEETARAMFDSSLSSLTLRHVDRIIGRCYDFFSVFSSSFDIWVSIVYKANWKKRFINFAKIKMWEFVVRWRQFSSRSEIRSFVSTRIPTTTKKTNTKGNVWTSFGTVFSFCCLIRTTKFFSFWSNISAKFSKFFLGTRAKDFSAERFQTNLR